MFYSLIKEDQIIWLALIGSLLIHCLLFVFSGKSFIQHAQFSVRPVVQRVEISYEEIKDTSSVPSIKRPNNIGVVGVISSAGGVRRSFNFKKVSSQPAVARNDMALKEVTQSNSGVKVKANPDYFQNPSPEYPELARQMHQEGLVMLSVDVDKEGDPVAVRIIQSSVYRMLDQAALKAVRRWKFQPGSIGGIPVDSTVNVPIRFRLKR